MTRLAYSVLVEESHLGTTQSIAREIRHHGFTVDRIVPEAGAIRAIGEEDAAAALRRIDGVLEVTPECGASLPPMSGEIPQ